MRARTYVSSIKDGPVAPFTVSPIPIPTRGASSRISHVRRKKGCMRDLCPRLFPGRTGRGPHIVRTDAEPIVSYLGYIGRLWPAHRLYRPRHDGRKKTYDWRVVCTGGKELTHRVPRQCYLVSIYTARAPASIRISRVITCVCASERASERSDSQGERIPLPPS